MDFHSPPPTPSTHRETCMLCDTTVNFKFVNKLRDDETRNVYQCETCGHIQILPLSSREEDVLLYKENDETYRRSHSSIAKFQNEENMMNKLRVFTEDTLIQFKKHINKNKKLIDIGTGYGWLVELMRNEGYEIDGVEISDKKRRLVKQRSGIELFNWNLLDVKDVPKGCYDVVSLMHVLEHISEPKIFLKRAADLLKPAGMIYIEVPNYDDYMKAILPEYNSFSYTRMHLSYFTCKTLSQLLINAGFKNIEIYGLQKYSFENALWWMREKRPFMDYFQMDVPECLQWLNALYKERVESEMKSYAIVAIGYRGN